MIADNRSLLAPHILSRPFLKDGLTLSDSEVAVDEEPVVAVVECAIVGAFVGRAVGRKVGLLVT